MPATFAQPAESVEGAECRWREARTQGVEAFRRGDLHAADGHFRDALARLCPVILGNDDPTQPDGDARDGAGIEEIPQYETWTRQWAAELLSCRAAALLGQKRYRDALAQAEKALELRDDWAKPGMQVCKARLGLGQYDKALECSRVASLQATPALREEARKFRARVEKAAYGKVLGETPPPPPPLPQGTLCPADPGEWDHVDLLPPDACKDRLAAVLARCEEADAIALLDEAHAKVERDGEGTRVAVMKPLMVRLQADALADFGYPSGERGVARFGMEMRKAMRGFPDDAEFRGLVAELSTYGRPRA